MRYAYVLEISDPNEDRSNKKLYRVIQQLGLTEDTVFVDPNPKDRKSWKELCEIIEAGDTILIRSITDLSNSLPEIYRQIFPSLQEAGVELFSCEEPFLCGKDYSSTLDRILLILRHFQIEKQKEGFANAVAAGRVGRPAKSDEAVSQAIKLYEAGTLTLTQIEKLTGVSKSTLYRYMKEDSEQ